MKNNYIRIRLTDDDKKTLKELAELGGVSISKYIRELIYIESLKNNIERGVNNGD